MSEFLCAGCQKPAIRRAVGQYFCDECRTDGYACIKTAKETFKAAGFVLVSLPDDPSDTTQ